MAGIYIHIPFCTRICNYCDFYRSSQLIYKNKLLNCLLLEIEAKSQYLEGERIETIYFGGGTPSLLTYIEVNNILKKIDSLFTISPYAEITFEANPDDLTPSYLYSLKENTLINRLSIGVQSFNDKDLVFLNRRHNSVTAINAIKHAETAGFNNIGIDLIYAIPGLTQSEWVANLKQAFDLIINHLSAYHLTYEPNTPLYKIKNKGIFIPATERESIRQFEALIEIAQKNHFEHYEISNFALKRQYSVHNTNYWKGEKYLGIGPSAHSYNTISRQWNVSDNLEYMRCISGNLKCYESEFLDDKTKFNEYIMTGLRTMWGINLIDIQKNYGIDYSTDIVKSAEPFIKTGKLLQTDHSLFLSEKGKLIADYIIASLFV